MREPWIARFRQRHAERMRSVFLQVLEMCREAGLVRLGLVALDGTKVKAKASLETNRTASSLDEQIARMMAAAEETDAREDRQFGSQRGDELPKALAGRADRLARLKACTEKLERRAGDAATRQREKIEARAAPARWPTVTTTRDLTYRLCRLMSIMRHIEFAISYKEYQKTAHELLILLCHKLPIWIGNQELSKADLLCASR